jgi:hypothetical protein
MMTKLICALPLALGLALVGCSGGTGGDVDAAPIVIPPDTAPAAIDTTPPPPADPYLWVVVQDTEQIACSTNGPGADIDAVALWSSAGTALGWGKIGTATYTANPLGNSCENVDCKGGNCKYAAIGTTFDELALIAYTEGEKDGFVQDVGDDAGYFSLNGGTLQIQIGDLTGNGLAKSLKSGDMIKVFEVDKTYITSGDAPATCVCGPEHYTVTLQSDGGKLLPLTPVLLAAENTTCTPLTALSVDGCGTTVFMVP